MNSSCKNHYSPPRYKAVNKQCPARRQRQWRRHYSLYPCCRRHRLHHHHQRRYSWRTNSINFRFSSCIATVDFLLKHYRHRALFWIHLRANSRNNSVTAASIVRWTLQKTIMTMQMRRDNHRNWRHYFHHWHLKMLPFLRPNSEIVPPLYYRAPDNDTAYIWIEVRKREQEYTKMKLTIDIWHINPSLPSLSPFSHIMPWHVCDFWASSYPVPGTYSINVSLRIPKNELHECAKWR